jgi:hypothetical protein
MERDAGTTVPFAAIRRTPYLNFEDFIIRLRAEGVIGEAYASHALSALFAVFKTNVLRWRHFRPQPYHGDVTLIQAGDRPPAEANQLAARLNTIVHGRLVISKTIGNHYTMINNPHAAGLADLLTQRE